MIRWNFTFLSQWSTLFKTVKEEEKKNSSFTVPDWWKEAVLLTKLSFLSCSSFFPQWKHAQKPMMKPKGKQEISWHHTQEAYSLPCRKETMQPKSCKEM